MLGLEVQNLFICVHVSLHTLYDVCTYDMGEGLKNFTKKTIFQNIYFLIGLLAKTIGGAINFFDVIGY